MNDPSSEEQALTTFNHSAEELRFFKGQQWHVTNYALIAYTALVASSRLVENGAVTCFSLLLVFVVLLAALVVLWSLEEALAKERGRLFTAREDHLPLIERIHRGDRRKYRSAISKRLGRFFHPEAPRRPEWRARIAKFVEANDPFVWLIAAIILGAFVAFVVIIGGPPTRAGG